MALVLWFLQSPLQVFAFRRSPAPPTDGPVLGAFAEALFTVTLVSLFTQDAFERFYRAFANGDITFVKHPWTRLWLIQVQGSGTAISLSRWAKDVYPGLVQVELDELLAQQRQTVA